VEREEESQKITRVVDKNPMGNLTETDGGQLKRIKPERKEL